MSLASTHLSPPLPKKLKTEAVALQSGEHLTIEYMNPAGVLSSFTISAAHLTFLVVHDQSECAIVVNGKGRAQLVS